MAPSPSSTSPPTFHHLTLQPLQHPACTSPNIYHLQLKSPPVNSMSVAWMHELVDVFEYINGNDQIRGVLLSSALPSSFCSGLNVLEGPSQLTSVEQTMHYGTLISESCTTPYRCHKPVASVVAGHAIGGGMLLAGAADFVVIDSASARKAQTGLIELQVGVPFTPSAMPTIRAMFNNNVAAIRHFIMGADLMSLQEAHIKYQFGDVMTDQPVEAAIQWLQQKLRIPTPTFTAAKQQINKPIADEALDGASMDTRMHMAQLFFDNRWMTQQQADQLKQRQASKARSSRL